MVYFHPFAALLLMYVYIYPRNTLELEPQHSSSPISFFSNFLFPSLLSPPHSLEKDSKFVKEGRKEEKRESKERRFPR